MKWQEINKKTSALILTGVFGLIFMISQLTGINVGYTNWEECINGTNCYARFDVNSSYYRICFNIDDSVETPAYFKKQSRSRTLWINTSRYGFVTTEPDILTKLMMGTIKSRGIEQAPNGKWLRNVKTGDCIERKKTNYLYVKGVKDKYIDVIWKMDLFKIDPIWKAKDKIIKIKGKNYIIKDKIKYKSKNITGEDFYKLVSIETSLSYGIQVYEAVNIFDKEMPISNFVGRILKKDKSKETNSMNLTVLLNESYQSPVYKNELINKTCNKTDNETKEMTYYDCSYNISVFDHNETKYRWNEYNITNQKIQPNEKVRIKVYATWDIKLGDNSRDYLPGVVVPKEYVDNKDVIIEDKTNAWWNSSWIYRKPINVSNTAGNQTNYQIKIELNSSNFNYSNANATGKDIRPANITDELDYWIETWNISGSSYIWVEVPFLENNINTTIYLYYGNPSVSSTSNGDNTFEFFDDFEGGERVNITNTNFNSKEDNGTALSEGTSEDWDYHISGELGNIIHDVGNSIGGDYIMVYSGYNETSNQCKVGLAYSTDRKNWTKYNENPVISSPWAEDLYLVKNDSTYYLYAEDTGNTNIQLFTSTNLVNWTHQGEVLSSSGSGWDAGSDIGSPTVWIEGSNWYMLYEGCNTPGGTYALGLANSTDGTTWTKEVSNPVFEKIDTNWVTGAISPDDICKDGSTYYMLYHGYDGSWKTGLTTSTNLTSWGDNLNSPILNFPVTMLNGGVDYIVYISGGAIYEAYPYYASSFDTDKYEKTHSVPTSIANGILRIQPPDATYHYYVRTKNAFDYPVVLEEKWKYMTGGGGWRTYFASDIDIDATGIWGIYSDAWSPSTFIGDLPATDTSYRSATKMQTSQFDVSMNDGAITYNKSGLSISSPQKVNIGGAGNTADIRIDFVFLREYSATEPTFSFGAEETETAGDTCSNCDGTADCYWDCSDDCNITSNINMMGYSIKVNQSTGGNHIINITANITNHSGVVGSGYNSTDMCFVIGESGGGFK